MNFSSYIERQKSIIRQRHMGEEVCVMRGEEVRVTQTEKILRDLCAMKGLNTAERLGLADRKYVEC